MIGLGIDVVDLDRFAESLRRRPRLLDKLFTPQERAYCQSHAVAHRQVERFAARFATKEATLKALGAGLGAFDWHDVALDRAPSGAPHLVVAGRAARLATDAGVTGWQVSVSHSALVAVAVVAAL